MSSAPPGTPGPPPSAQRAALDLPAHASACAVARRAVREVLQTWDVAEERLHDALLVVSELVGNAVRYGGRPLHLDLSLEAAPAGPVLTVGVADASPVLPRQREAAADAESGRGLPILAALAQDWGAEPAPGRGKRVWARLPLSA